MRLQTFDHSVFLIEGSNHSYHRALHCFGVLRTKSEEIRALELPEDRDQGKSGADGLTIGSFRTLRSQLSAPHPRYSVASDLSVTEEMHREDERVTFQTPERGVSVEGLKD